MRLRLILLFSILLSFSSCDDPFYKGSPQFVLYIQDLPARDINALNISFSKVEIFDNNQWIELKCNTMNFNLIEYNGGTMFELSKANIPSGKYSKFRITLAPNFNSIEYLAKNYSLLLSNENSVLTFDYEFEAVENKQEIVLCDIDVASSVSGDPASGIFWFTPKATLINLNTWGVVQGVLVNAAHKRLNIKCLVTAIREDGYQLHNYTSNTGDIFIRLPKGKYSITITPKSTSKETETVVPNIIVESDQPTSMGGVIMALPKK